MITKTIRTRLEIGLALFLGLAMMVATGTGPGTAYAADGDLDPAFGGDGRVTTDFIATHDEARAVAIQADGKIVVAGTTLISGSNWNFAVARYNPNGSPDTTFSLDGKLTTDFGDNLDDGAYGVAIQPDGKIVAVGAYQFAQNSSVYIFAVARYNTNGSLDPNFGVGGLVKNVSFGFWGVGVANSVAIDADGKIVLAGYSTLASGSRPTNFALARLNPNGTLDNSFDSDGRLTTDFAGGRDEARAVVIQSNGKIVVAGTAQINGNFNFALARYNENGSLNNGLSGDGKANFDYFGGEDGFNSLALQPDGKIVAAGYTYINPQTSFNFAVVRVTSTGSLDTTFDIDGRQTVDVGAGGLDEAKGVALQADGKIVLAGYAPVGGVNDFALVRLHTTGALDPSFNGDGILTHDFGGGVAIANDVAIQPDGKIVTAGLAFMGATEYDVAVARYLNVTPQK